MDTSLVAASAWGSCSGSGTRWSPDHVAAGVHVRQSGARAARARVCGGVLGAIGHTAALMAAGVAIVGLQGGDPAQLRADRRHGGRPGADPSGRVTCRCARGNALRTCTGHAHAHDGSPHRHLHVHVGRGRRTHGHFHPLAGRAATPAHGPPARAGGRRRAGRPGHGHTIPSPAAARLYIAVFGVGSTAGMLVLSGLIGAAVRAHRRQLADDRGRAADPRRRRHPDRRPRDAASDGRAAELSMPVGADVGAGLHLDRTRNALVSSQRCAS